MRKGYLFGGAAVTALVLAVRLSGPRSEAPAPPRLAEPSLSRPLGAPSEAPGVARPVEPVPQARPQAAAPVDSPLLQSGDLAFGPADERTPQGRLVYVHRFYFPYSGRGSIVENAVRVTVDGEDRGIHVLPPPEADAAPTISVNQAARILRVPLGAPDRPHEVVIEFRQDRGGKTPTLLRDTFRCDAGPRSDWRMTRSQWAPDGVNLQDIQLHGHLGQ